MNVNFTKSIIIGACVTASACTNAHLDPYSKAFSKKAWDDLIKYEGNRQNYKEDDFKPIIFSLSQKKCVLFMPKKSVAGSRPVVCYYKNNGQIAEIYDRDGG